jgi:hypothetical protein
MTVFLFHEFPRVGVKGDPGAFFGHAWTLNQGVMKASLFSGSKGVDQASRWRPLQKAFLECDGRGSPLN